MSTRLENEESPSILKAIDIIIASPESIQEDVRQMEEKYMKRYANKMEEEEIQDKLAEHIISNYSYYTAFTGGATALTGVIPGLGTVIAAVGGATADAAVTMKWEIEMVMAIATVYGRDITIEEEKRLCYLVAGLGVLNEATKKGVAGFSTKALQNMAKLYLKGPSLVAVKEVFKKVESVLQERHWKSLYLLGLE